MPISAPCALCQGQLLVAGGGRDHARAHRPADLHRRQAHAARGSQHEQRLAGAQAAAIGQAVQRRAVHQHEAGRGLEIHAVRQFQRAAGLGHHLLGEPAYAGQRHDAVADGEIGHAVAQAPHDAGDLAARRERPRRLHLVLAAHHQAVGEVHPGRMYLDQDLAGARSGVRPVLQGKRLDGPERVTDDRLHGSSLACGPVGRPSVVPRRAMTAGRRSPHS